MTTAHRTGPLKQTNKKHNTGKHRSKNAIKSAAKGRTANLKCIVKPKNKLNRLQKKHQLKQKKLHKLALIEESKKNFIGESAPPLLTSIISLDENYSSEAISRMLSCADNELIVSHAERNVIHVCAPRFKRRHAFISPNHSSLYDVLDSLKAADFVLILWPRNGVLSEESELLLNAAMAHGLPNVASCVHGLSTVTGKQRENSRKNVVKLLEQFSFNTKFYEIDTQAHALALLRVIGDSKKRSTNIQLHRANLFVEKIDACDEKDSKCTLRLTGYVRGGRNINVKHAIHLPGYGDFLMDQVEIAETDPYAFPTKNKCSSNSWAFKAKRILKADPSIQWNMQSEVTPDPMDCEQTWPTNEEIADAQGQHQFNLVTKKKKVLPKGTSEYQAAWIVDSDEDDDNSCSEKGFGTDEGNEAMSTDDGEFPIEASDEPVLTPIEMSESIDGKSVRFADALSITSETPTTFIDTANNEGDVAIFRAARQNQLYPDEVDTPLHQDARMRFQKFRGLKSFRTSEWDPRENLPYDFARIFKFENFNRTRKRVFTKTEEPDEAEKFCAAPGQFVRLSIKNTSITMAEALIASKSALIVYQLLEHEQKMSLVNMVVRRHPSAMKKIVKNKSPLIFHVGYRRFIACPIITQHTNGDKHKMERYLPTNDSANVLSVFAPIMYPPSSVLVFYEDIKGRHRLLATGGILSVSPDRLMIKRIVLSGHPYKIHSRSVVVRYMFYNPRDVLWFKPVELKTKYGRRGHIKEPIGTHGHMKCTFDGHLNSQDTVLMHLYKRVFPKWTYEPNVPPPINNCFTAQSTDTTLFEQPCDEIMIEE